MNVVMLIGRTVAHPELKYTQGTNIPVCTFRLAVDRRFKDQNGNKITDFIDCVAWRQQAELINNYVDKGKLIAVQGTLQVRTWQTQDGQNRKTVEVVVDNMQMLEKRQQNDGYGAPVPTMAPPDPFGATEGIPDWGNNTASQSAYNNQNNGSYQNFNQSSPIKEDADYDPFSDE